MIVATKVHLFEIKIIRKLNVSKYKSSFLWYDTSTWFTYL